MGMALPKAMTLTDAAADRVKALVSKGQESTAEEQILGLRVGVKSRGCSGLSYFVEYAKERKKFEEMVEDKGVKIFIDPAATMFLLGSEMDYVESTLQSGFVFNNPNEKSRCGCGESFSV
jgi:iron-sulfur cluster assembly accessory protein